MALHRVTAQPTLKKEVWRRRSAARKQGLQLSSQLFTQAKGPRTCTDEFMSRSLEPEHCVDSTADRNINPNPHFG